MEKSSIYIYLLYKNLMFLKLSYNYYYQKQDPKVEAWVRPYLNLLVFLHHFELLIIFSLGKPEPSGGAEHV